MSTTQQHIIKRQIIEMELPNREEARHWQDYFSELYKREILPMIDEYCSSISSADEVITIDSLELDIGKIDIKNPSDFVRKVKNSLQEQLYRKCDAARNNTASDAKCFKINSKQKQFLNSKKTSLLGSGKSENGPDAFLEKNENPVHSASQDVLLYYLKNGNFPWWNTDNTINSQVVFRQLESATSEYLQIVKPLLKYPAIRKRILYGISKDNRKDFLIRIFPKAKQVIGQLELFFEEWKQLPFFSKTNKPFIFSTTISSTEKWEKGLPISFLEKTITILLEKNNNSITNNIFSTITLEWIKNIIQKHQLPANEIIPKTLKVIQKMNFQTSDLESLIRKEFSFLEENKLEEKLELKSKSKEGFELDSKSKESWKEDKEFSKIINPIDEIKNETAFEKTFLKNENQINTEEGFTLESTTSLDKQYIPKISEAEEWYVENSGIVLSWCYLQYFFQGLNLMENGAFINEETQWKAVHLLQYLAFGDAPYEESDLVLNKVLCGLSPEDFVPDNIAFTNTEIEECEHLLQVIIDNWKVLKKTSVYGLRTTFLQRQGVLSKDHQGWVLKVEAKTLDILLEKLDWSISVIKLPWNQKFIHVTW